jgi:hypothetical protein
MKNSNRRKETTMAVDPDKLKKTHPNLYAAIFKRGFDAAKAEAPKPSAVSVDSMQAQVNKQLGISTEEFLKHAPRANAGA